MTPLFYAVFRHTSISQGLCQRVEIGLPLVYRQWREENAPPLPYCVYYAGRSRPFGADGVVYTSSQAYTLEVYTGQKDPAIESRVEGVLSRAGLFFVKNEAYIDSESMQEIIYEIEV